MKRRIESIKGSISSLEKCARTLARKLEAEGRTVKIDVIKANGDYRYGRNSRIDLTITTDGNSYYRKIEANGYGYTGTWSEIKAEILADLS
jgi:hypothetical protein